MKRSTKVLFGLFATSVVLNILFYFSTGITDAYVKYVFRKVSVLMTLVSGLFPFSIAELVIAGFVVFVLVGFIGSVIWAIVKKKERMSGFKIYGKIIAWVLTVAFLLCTLNWFSLYKASSAQTLYLTKASYSEKQWLKMYDYITLKIQELDKMIKRDENGYFVYEGETAGMIKEAKTSMKNLGKMFPELDGFYPQAKPLLFSFFMSQSGTTGIYLPLFVEANFNTHIVDGYLPVTLCHEFSHLKGFIQEEEANFFGIMACVNSSDIGFQYSGYLDMLTYLNGDMPDKMSEEFEEKVQSCGKRLSSGVIADMYRYFPDNYWEEHEDEVIIPTDIVEKVDHIVYDKTLQINGVQDGILSYDRVTECLLDYFTQYQTFDIIVK